MNVTVLAGTAGLFLMFTLYVGIAFDGLSVCDLLRNSLDADAESVFQLG